MRKSNTLFLRKVISFILCLAVCVGLLVHATVKKTEAADSGILLVDASLTLWDDGKIGMNLYFSGISDAGVNNYTVNVSGETYTIYKKDTRGYYYITYYLDAKDILKSRTIKVYRGSSIVPLTNSEAVNGAVTVSGEDYLNQCIALLGSDKKADIVKSL